MIAHLVLFRPKSDLTLTGQNELADALSHALSAIPAVRTARVGRRVRHGRGYEQSMRVDYSHVAVLEFDDVEGLRTYLNHPAHERVATAFYDAFEEALIYDFSLQDATPDAVRGLIDQLA